MIGGPLSKQEKALFCNSLLTSIFHPVYLQKTCKYCESAVAHPGKSFPGSPLVNALITNSNPARRETPHALGRSE